MVPAADVVAAVVVAGVVVAPVVVPAAVVVPVAAVVEDPAAALEVKQDASAIGSIKTYFAAS